MRNINGAWWTYDEQFGYCEFDFKDSIYKYFISESGQGMSLTYNYIIDNCSISTNNNVIEVYSVSDTVLILKVDDKIVKLNRIPNIYNFTLLDVVNCNIYSLDLESCGQIKSLSLFLRQLILEVKLGIISNETYDTILSSQRNLMMQRGSDDPYSKQWNLIDSLYLL